MIPRYYAHGKAHFDDQDLKKLLEDAGDLDEDESVNGVCSRILHSLQLESPKMITTQVFHEAVKNKKFNISKLLRFSRSISLMSTTAAKRMARVSSEVPLDESNDEQPTENESCLKCSRKKYEYASHVVSLTPSGRVASARIINPSKLS